MRTDDRFVIEGTLCVIKINGKYLLRLEQGGINNGSWIFPGGSYDREESGARELGVECITREVQEEVGITPVRPKLRARIFFDNFKRIFPGKTEIASFDYDALYFYTEDYTGELKEISPDGRKQGLFSYEETLKLPMHEGDREILKALEKIPQGRVFEGRIVHNGSRIESAIFQDI